MWSSHITPAPFAAHYSTDFAIPYFKSHHIGHIMHHTATSRIDPISHYVPHNATFHVLHATFQISHTTIYWPHYASNHHITHHSTFYTTLHRISQAASRDLHNCIIPPHLTVITPNSTSHYHVSHNIPHQSHISIPPHSTSQHLSHLA